MQTNSKLQIMASKHQYSILLIGRKLCGLALLALMLHDEGFVLGSSMVPRQRGQTPPPRPRPAGHTGLI